MLGSTCRGLAMAAAVLGLAAVPVPSGAEAGEGAPPTFTVDAPTRHPAVAWAEVVADPGTALHPAAYARAMEATVEDLWGVDFPDSMAATADESDEPAGGWEPLPMPAGDLDGDGLDDLYVVDVGYGPGFAARHGRARALHGTDGRELWDVDLGSSYALFPIVGELTGDGVDDVVAYGFDFLSFDGGQTCAPLAACHASSDITYRWKVRVLSGVDGAVAWSREWTGRTRVDVVAAQPAAGGASTAALAPVFVEENGFVVVQPSADHDGDGGRDLVTNAFGVTDGVAVAVVNSPAAWAGAAAQATRYATRAEVASGATGAVLFQRDTDGGLGSLAPLHHPTEPAGAEAGLLWQELRREPTVVACAGVSGAAPCAASQGLALTAELLDGRTFEPTWQFTRDDPALLFAALADAAGDVDADGTGDLVLYEILAGDVAPTPRLSLLAGATGTTMWSRDTAALAATVGPVGERPGADVVLAEFLPVFGPEGVTVTLRLERVDGATGTSLFTTEETRVLPNGGGGTVRLVPDGDGDGVDEIGVTFSQFGRTRQAHTRVESGRTGATLHALSEEGVGVLVPAGDLDGDGAGDLLDVRFRSPGTMDATAVSLRTGLVAWRWTDSMGADGGALGLNTGANLLDPSTADVLFVRVSLAGGRATSRLDAVDGSAGTAIWTHEDAPAEGGISGTVADPSGSPLPWVCASAVLPNGGFAAGAVSDHKGRFVLEALAPGPYRLLFVDCGGRGLVDEWYRDRRAFDDAEAVEVIGGHHTRDVAVVMDVPRRLRVESKAYAAAPGAAAALCPPADVGVGGVCFELDRSEGRVAIDVRDLGPSGAGGTYAFVHGHGPDAEVLWSGTFCSGPVDLFVPPLSDRLEVRVGKPVDACPVRPETAGTVTATFSTG